MNRLAAAPSLPVMKAATARIDRPALRTAPWAGPPHFLIAPEHYERAYAYPLLVWLHSKGSTEREVQTVMPLVSKRNYAYVGVRGPLAHRTGYCWSQEAAAIGDAEQAVLEAISRARTRFNIHSERIFIAGYEAAGTMAVRLALRNPDRFAGAASLNGPFPAGHAPLSRLACARQVKLLVAHCRDSQDYPLDQVCQELSLYHTASLSVNLRQYPCEDELNTQMLRDLDAWMMEQVTGTPSSENEPAHVPSEWN